MHSREQHFGGVPRLLGLLLLGLAGPALGQDSKPERLSKPDIMAVVLSHKPEVVECVKEQAKNTPESVGKHKVMMRWTITPEGQTANVSCVSGCETLFSTCVAELIKSWTYPAHQVQGEPVDFPFTL
jgi:hypothetical protein